MTPANRPKILLVHPDLFYGAVHSPPLTSLVRSLPDFDFVILTPLPPEGESRGSWPPNVSFVGLPGRWLDRLGRRLPGAAGRIAGIPNELWKAFAYHRLARTEPGDLVHVHMGLEVENLMRVGRKLRLPVLWQLARALNDLRSVGKPVVLTEHSLFSRRSELGFPNPLHEADLLVTSPYPNVICVDRDSYGYLGRRDAQARIRRNRWYIPNGIDTTRFAFAPHPPRDTLTLGYSGRLFRSGESPTFLPQVAARLPHGVELRLAVATTMPVDEVRRRWFSNAPVVVHRNIPNDEMPSFYTGIDLLVNPYLWGGVGRNSLEAMSCGRPVMMFDNADHYPVTRETGYLIPPDDTEAFLSLVAGFRNDRESLAARGRRARDVVVGEFDERIVANSTSKVYGSLLADPLSPSEPRGPKKRSGPTSRAG